MPDQQTNERQGTGMSASADRLVLARHLPNRTVALVLAGGRGSRLHDLTDKRAKPAVYFGGKFRIIDFALSNCINSGIRRIGVLTQYKSHSLLRHLQRGWNFLRGEATNSSTCCRRSSGSTRRTGTAARPTRCTRTSTSCAPTDPSTSLVLAGDHIYKMDYSLMLLDHVESGAAAPSAASRCRAWRPPALGVMAIDDQRRITDFLEKPADPPGMPGKPDRALGSMGIYVFNAEYLYQLLEEDLANDSVRARLRQEHHSRAWCARAACWRTRSTCRACRTPAATSRTGATSAPSTRSGPPTWTSRPTCPS